MKHSDQSGQRRLFGSWTSVAAASMLAMALAGCGGDGADGAAGPAGPAGPPGADGAPGQDLTGTVSVPSNTTPATEASAAAWKALSPTITVNSVTINSAPVVKFTVTDAEGKPVVGLGNRSKSATATVPTLVNVRFTLAKLVPGTSSIVGGVPLNAEPSKWVSYLVVRTPTVAEKTAVPATSSCDAATNATWCGTYPTTESEGTLVDNGDGSYQYTFYRDVKQVATIVASLTDSKDGLAKKADLGDVSYDETATHRLGMQIGGAAPGTGSNLVDPTTLAPVTPAPASVSMVDTANAVYDFVPNGAAVTATRDIVDMASCSSCHAGKVLAHGSRKDPNYCVTCHTEQIKYTFSQEASSTNGGLTLTGTTAKTTSVVNGRALGNFPNMIHKTHMGEELVKTGYLYAGALNFNEVTYPQPATNCVKCHDGSATAVVKTPNGDNYKTAPNMLACGACHDGINFATGGGVTLADRDADVAAAKPVGTTQTGHEGGAKADNNSCVICHDAATLTTNHVTVDPTGANGRGGYPLNTAQDVPTPGYPSGQGPAIPLASQLNLPAGVYKIGLEIKQASVAGAAGAKKATVVYRILKDGVPVTLNPTGFLITGVDGTPSVYVAYAAAKDGIAAPADWTTTASATVLQLRDKLAGNSQTGPDANGWYTATLAAIIPDAAKMVTAGFGINYNGFVQLNHPSYPKGIRLREPGFAIKLADGYTARRSIVKNDNCNSCHGQLGVKPSFHSGARNNGEGCAFCHLPDTATGHTGPANGYGGGWSVSAKNLIHGIHASEMRTQDFTYEATAANPGGFAEVTYPGVLNKCQQCHVAGSYDFSASANAAAVPNLLWTTEAKTNMTNPQAPDTARVEPIGLSPWIKTLGRGEVDYTADNLVSSPISSSCFGCHDSQSAVNHFKANGGMLYASVSAVNVVPGSVDRTKGFNQTEACTVCHGPGRVSDIKAVHK